MQLLEDVHGLLQRPGTHKVLLAPSELLLARNALIGSIQVQSGDMIPQLAVELLVSRHCCLFLMPVAKSCLYQVFLLVTDQMQPCLYQVFLLVTDQTRSIVVFAM